VAGIAIISCPGEKGNACSGPECIPLVEGHLSRAGSHARGLLQTWGAPAGHHHVALTGIWRYNRMLSCAACRPTAAALEGNKHRRYESDFAWKLVAGRLFPLGRIVRGRAPAAGTAAPGAPPSPGGAGRCAARRAAGPGAPGRLGQRRRGAALRIAALDVGWPRPAALAWPTTSAVPAGPCSRPTPAWPPSWARSSPTR